MILCCIMSKIQPERRISRPKDADQIQNIKNQFSFSSLNNEIKYKYQLLEKSKKVEAIKRRIKDIKKKIEYLRLLKEQKKRQRIYRELLRRGHVSLLKDFQSAIYIK